MISNKTFMEFRTFCFKFPTLKQISLKYVRLISRTY